ncbi:nuclear transport factor 2 family protein [Alteromonas sp. D210916BOD_24]|uniref:nuclear transport factor 2 family protein n=1 Tax=Alteromonas sp. D210916BOD_24 TaxID=3157618 RepID=UPI00399C4B3A
MNVIERFCDIYADICQISPDELNAIYAKDIVFIDPITTHRGLEDVKTYFARLLDKAESCRFSISDVFECHGPNTNVTHVANWTMTLVLLKSNKVIYLDGTTQLSVKDNIIVYHKDYYDLGEMVYEHIPVLGFLIRTIKRKLAS